MCNVCVVWHLNLGSARKMFTGDLRGTGRWVGQVHLGCKSSLPLPSKISCFLFIVAVKCCSMKITGLWPLTWAELGRILRRMPYCFSALSDLIMWPVRASFSSRSDTLDVIVGHSATLRLKGHQSCQFIITNAAFFDPFKQISPNI